MKIFEIHRVEEILVNENSSKVEIYRQIVVLKDAMKRSFTFRPCTAFITDYETY
jgi:hypothetical protein